MSQFLRDFLPTLVRACVLITVLILFNCPGGVAFYKKRSESASAKIPLVHWVSFQRK